MTGLFVLMAILIVLAVAGLMLKGQKPGGVESLPYEARKELFTSAERSFFGVLVQAVGEEYLIFGKVRLADLMHPVKGLSKSRRTTALNRISRKHVDFVLCRPDTLAVVGVIELDDATHQRQARAERDDLVDRAFASAGIPMLRFAARKAYAVQEVRAKLVEGLALEKEASGALQAHAPVVPEPAKPALESAAMPEISAETSQPKVESIPPERAPAQEELGPVCPACNSRMIKRQAKKGPHAGKWFWACAEFPRCRKILAVGS